VLEPYGLGTERTLADYAAYSGLDCASQTIAPEARIGIEPTAP
jgi:hypothetical protein